MPGELYTIEANDKSLGKNSQVNLIIIREWPKNQTPPF